MVATLVVGIVHSIHAHVDDHAALLDHVSLHEVGDAHSGDDDVRLLKMLLQVSRAGGQIVTVALRRKRSMATGMPTMLLRPITTAFFPAISTL